MGIRPSEIYETWGYNEVISTWIPFAERSYQEKLANLKKEDRFKEPKTYFIYKNASNQKEFVHADTSLFEKIEKIKKLDKQK